MKDCSYFLSNKNNNHTNRNVHIDTSYANRMSWHVSPEYEYECFLPVKRKCIDMYLLHNISQVHCFSILSILTRAFMSLLLV